MADNKTAETGKPLQLIPFSEKTEDWYKDNGRYFLKNSKFHGGRHGSILSEGDRDIDVLYQVYNNKFPKEWFAHITDPLSAKNKNHKNFPAKIRPVTILRTNIDLLQAEYPRRPFVHQVNNLSDDAYSKYQESLEEHMRNNVTERFRAELQMNMMQEGLITQDGQPASEEAMAEVEKRMQEFDIPEKVQEDFLAGYKDSEAIRAQKWLRRALVEHRIRQKLQKGIKHWMIAGSVFSYKTVEFDKIIYKVFGELDVDFEKAEQTTYVEDGEWFISREFLTVSDAVDMYYDELTRDEVEDMERSTHLTNTTTFYNHLSNHAQKGKIAKFHIVWKGKKRMGIVTRIGEDGEAEEIEVDEDYKVDKAAGETVEWMTVNEMYETTQLTEDIWVRSRPVLYQRNSLNNFSECKLPYNGRMFSDLHAENISPLELGLPIQIMYMIVTRTLELTMAKSKGKILLIDNNAIPRENGWDEEKFFYYAEALGYGLLDRNQIGVDKSWNQYQVLDMTLFDSIQQLIQLQQHFRQEWDDLLGISRQRKGQTYASDGQGVNERAVFQSTIITDMIFNLYEDWVQTELQGLIDLSKFTAIDGLNQLWNSTEYGNELLEVVPESYCTAQLGVMLESSSEAINIKNKLEQNVQAMLQNGAKPSTIIKVLQSANVAELKRTLEHIENAEAQASQQAQQSEAEAKAAEDERAMKFKEFEHTLDTMFMHEEFDRKEDIEMIRGEFNTFTFQDGDSNDNGVPDAVEVMNHKLEREKVQSEARKANLERLDRLKKESEDRKLKREELASKEKIAKSKKPKA